MSNHQKSGDNDIFRDFLTEVEPIRFKEPFAEILGAFKKDEVVLEYTFVDVVKMAGHACPTTAGAYLCCQEALKKLYPNELPIRGDISITVYGEADEGGYGVISQVFSFLTGAAPATGFRGLGHKFRRKDLLRFNPESIDSQAFCFEFSRADNGKTVLVKFYPSKIPFSEVKSRRLGELLEKVIWEAAKEEERREFQDLWIEKVRDMILERKQINEWIKIEEGSS
jgi:formylmethanofuran dehydrogenase subunit E